MRDLITPPFRNEIVHDMDWSEYLASAGFNPSWLVHGIKSMKHFRASTDAPEKPSRGKLVGSATHTLILEPEKFDKRFAVWEGERRAGNDYRDFCARAESLGIMDIIKRNELEQAEIVASAVRNHTPAMDVLSRVEPEVSLFCEDLGLQCRGRVDGLGSGVMVDVKTTTNVEARSFGRIFAQLHYASKLALYKRWAEKLGHIVDEVLIICVETQSPYDVAVVPVPNIILENSWSRMEAVMRSIPACVENDQWKGVAESGYYELNVPNWSMDEDEILDWSE